MASNTLTYRESPARHPGEQDVLVDLKTNFPTNQPCPPNMISGEEYNQLARQVAAMASGLWVAIVKVQIAAGIPSIVALWTRRGDLSAADFLVNDLGTGDTQILCQFNKLPTLKGFHMVSVNSWVDGVPYCMGDIVDQDGIGVRVRTSALGAPVDAAFTSFWL